MPTATRTAITQAVVTRVKIVSAASLLTSARTVSCSLMAHSTRIKTSETSSMQSTSDLKVIEDRPTPQPTSQVTICEKTRNAPFAHLLTLLRALDRLRVAIQSTISTLGHQSRTKVQRSALESAYSSEKRKKRGKSRSVMSKKDKKLALKTSSNDTRPQWLNKTSSARAKTSNTNNSRPPPQQLSSNLSHRNSKRKSRLSTPCLMSSRRPTITWRISMSRLSKRKAMKVMSQMTSSL